MSSTPISISDPSPRRIAMRLPMTLCRITLPVLSLVRMVLPTLGKLDFSCWYRSCFHRSDSTSVDRIGRKSWSDSTTDPAAWPFWWKQAQIFRWMQNSISHGHSARYHRTSLPGFGYQPDASQFWSGTPWRGVSPVCENLRDHPP